MRNIQKLSQAQEIIMVKDLQRIMPINELQAREILLQTQWNLQRANNIILDLQGKSHNAEEQFRKYAKGDLIEDQGIINFCKDLGIDLMDPIILYISFSFKAERMGQFTKFDFIYGFNQLKIVDTIDLRNRIPKLREEFKKMEVFKSVYKFCFDFAKEKKDLPYEIAQGLWDTLLKPLFPIMGKFLEYVENIPEKSRQPITRDTYLMVLEFCVQIGNDLTKYDYKNGAWPIFLDNFYYFMFPEAKNQQGYY